MNSQEEAKKLYEQIVKAQKAFEDNDFENSIKESEVSFRYKAVKAMLCIARNEVWQMFKEWNEDVIK